MVGRLRPCGKSDVHGLERWLPRRPPSALGVDVVEAADRTRWNLFGELVI